MPTFKIYAKTEGKRRELWGYVKAKTAKEAIEKAKTKDRKQVRKVRKYFPDYPYGRSWKAVKVKKKKRSSSGMPKLFAGLL